MASSKQSLQLLPEFEMAGKPIGPGHPCFIVYEAGPTHHSLESAKSLVKMAADAGADAVKFQLVDPDRLVADRTQPFTYEILVDRDSGETKQVTEPLYDILVRRVLAIEEWRELKKYSDALGLAFFATVNFFEDLELIQELGCDSVKIGSADVTHLPLIRAAAQTGACIQLDTGNSTLGEIETAVDAIVDEGNQKVIIHQCPSGYPARLDSINLRIIPTLKQMFGCPTAYSDHTPGWDMDIAALTIGANLVEKTITLDRTTPSVEHIMSLEQPQIDEFVQVIRDVETALGRPRRLMHDEERAKRKAIRRSVFLQKDAVAGTCLRDAVIEYRRPGYGLTPAEYERFADAVLREDLPAGACLSLSDLTMAPEEAKVN